jgi:uncharacterized protein (TIGR03032 family)
VKQSPPRPDEELAGVWARHNAEWRDTAQIASQWQEAAETDPELLRYKVSGRWWETLEEAGITLLITREYEHLVIAMTVIDGRPHVSYMRMPHPSGLVVDRERGLVYIASTRNPNMIYEMAPVQLLLERSDVKLEPLVGRPLVPTRSWYFPGCLYLHDLALIDGVIHGNAVGQNAVIRIDERGGYERVWWPRCVEVDGRPIFEQNYIQLNSIAAGDDLASSYFTASSDRISARRPGHRNYPVDRRGVVFAGTTRETVARGLTRPHSARLWDGQVWVDNSGYGELVVVRGESPTTVGRFPGWTRGLAIHERIAFVGTSRIIPRFRQYAPGLDLDESLCGVHAVDLLTGQILGSLNWPKGNQIFAVEVVPSDATTGFILSTAMRSISRVKRIYFANDVSRLSSERIRTTPTALGTPSTDRTRERAASEVP